ncbi:KDPG/KHG aldolase protein [Dioscorea alata]|uniref:KDPG/KHG aldolase protein n=1 Tax=Dioscorea alata TaxID=55571 RepID=A0ACB7VVI1_DIOAL|nr:KDPG/KHG aldolase protein [Dioscorea alata]
MAATMLSLSSPLSPSSHPPCSSPPPPPPRALLEIQRSRVIACLRASEGQLALEASRAALRGGVSVVGTVLDVVDARKAINVGAKFLMSPCTVMDILFDVQDDEVLYIPGVMTPTEVLSAYKSGARIVKFPFWVVINTYQLSRNHFLIFQWLLLKGLQLLHLL